MRSLQIVFKALVVALCCVSLSASANAGKIRVVATVPDLADIAGVIGGDAVKVHSICRGRENLHSASPRPSDLIALSKADLFIQLGLSAEAAWLPSLLNRARNRKIASGAIGFVNASEGWKAIGVPTDNTRDQGDIHPQGNPHFNLHPAAGRHIASRILAGLIRIDPARRPEYETRYEAYLIRLEAAEARWKALGKRFEGSRVVVYHMEFNYLAELYGIEIVGSLESKPGIPPTPAHLAQLIGRMRDEAVQVVLTAPWSNNRFVSDVAKKSGAVVVLLPTMLESNFIFPSDSEGGWIGMMDLVHARLAEAFGVTVEEPATENG